MEITKSRSPTQFRGLYYEKHTIGAMRSIICYKIAVQRCQALFFAIIQVVDRVQIPRK